MEKIKAVAQSFRHRSSSFNGSTDKECNISSPDSTSFKHELQVTVDENGKLIGLPAEWKSELDAAVEDDTSKGVTNAQTIKDDVVKFFKETYQEKKQTQSNFHRHSSSSTGFASKFGLGRSKATEDLTGERLSKSIFYSDNSSINDELSSRESQESTSTLTEENQPSELSTIPYDESAEKEKRKSTIVVNPSSRPEPPPKLPKPPSQKKRGVKFAEQLVRSGSIMREDDEVITLDRTTMLNEKQIVAKIKESCNTQPLKSIYSIKVNINFR